ncbi:MAG: hypothetical protein ACLUE8_13815 [Lachnospiraceae bacterium]
MLPELVVPPVEPALPVEPVVPPAEPVLSESVVPLVEPVLPEPVVPPVEPVELPLEPALPVPVPAEGVSSSSRGMHSTSPTISRAGWISRLAASRSRRGTPSLWAIR